MGSFHVSHHTMRAFAQAQVIGAVSWAHRHSEAQSSTAGVSGGCDVENACFI